LAAGLLPLLLVRGAAQVWIIFAVMFWEGAVQQFFSPAEQAMVPRLVSDDEFMMANAASGQVANVSRLAGSALGGVLAAFGGIAGGMVAAVSGHRFRAGRLMCYGAVAFGLVDLAIFLYPLGYVAVWPAVAGMIVVGLPGALTLAGLITLFQRSSEDAYRGRVFGAVSALEGFTVLAGTLGSGYLSRLAGIIPVLAVQGAGYVVAGLAMLVWLKEEPGERAGVGAQRQDGPALVTAE